MDQSYIRSALHSRIFSPLVNWVNTIQNFLCASENNREVTTMCLDNSDTSENEQNERNIKKIVKPQNRVS